MEIKQEDVDTYIDYVNHFKRNYEKKTGKIFKPVHNPTILQSIAEKREADEKLSEEKLKEFEKKLEEFLIMIDPKVKSELDLRLAKGEISHEEYQQVIRTLVWTNKAYLPPAFKKHMENVGPVDPQEMAARREIDIVQNKKRKEKELEEMESFQKQQLDRAESETKVRRHAEKILEKNKTDSSVEELQKSQLENLAQDIREAQEKEREEKAVGLQEKITDSAESSEESIKFTNGMQIVALLKPELSNMSVEAGVIIDSIRNSYGSINQGCSCTKNKRIAIAQENYKRNISDLGEDLGIIEHLKRVTKKDKIIFADENGVSFLES